MKSFYSASCLAAGIFFSVYVYSQGIPDWVWKTPMTKVYPTGEYNNFPMVDNNYIHQNTSTRVVNNGTEDLVIPPNEDLSRIRQRNLSLTQ